MSFDQTFLGTERFEILGQLGAGGMGVVYRALDREQGIEVALKRLHAMDASALMQLKLEFRRMRDIVHANLVSLGELIRAHEDWFFTMELVEGSDLLRALRPGWRYPSSELLTAPLHTSAAQAMATRPITQPTAPLPASAAGSATSEEAFAAAARCKVDIQNEAAAPSADWELVRSLFLQLVEGVSTLHQQGILHRDIKPPNIRVTPAHRLVLLDFGIAEARSRAASSTRHGRRELLGTPLYMAPELYSGGDAGTASDWYSVGMVLYQALVGRSPLVGSSADILEYKSKFDLHRPRTWSPDVPEDLDELCMQLLSRNPEQRPDASELLHRLDRRAAGRPRRHLAGASLSGSGVFVGRAEELRRIREAFARTRQGQSEAVIIQGESGLGKTVLAQHALDALVTDVPDTLVLKGRSHQRESVPFKAFDGIVDELTSFLLEQTPETRHALTPEGAELIAHLFPVLGRVEGFKPVAHATAELPTDPLERRRQSFVAFRELIGRVAWKHPLVLFLDDLHWADRDSLQLLRELMRGPGAPPLLALSTVRPGELGEWHPPQSSAEELLGQNLLRLSLEPLEAEQVHRLVRSLAPGSAEVSRQLYRLSEESGGHPLYLQELMRHLQTHGTLPSAFPLDEALWGRTESLPREAKHLLHLVALAGRPLPNETLREASELPAEPFAQAVRLLSTAQLLRSRGLRREDAIEPFHDRVRETVVNRLQPDSKRILHRKLADALERVGPAEPETIAIHWDGAGNAKQALIHAEQAATAADAAFAFDRAVRLYRYCLKLCDAPSERQRLLSCLGWALVNSGSSTEAGETFLQASEAAAPADAVALKRLAAEKLLQGGDLERGLPQMREALAAAGVRYWNNPRRALLPMLWTRLKLAFRGLTYQLRPESEIPREALARMDAAESCANVFTFLDPICGQVYTSQFLLWALDAGERLRLSRAFASEYLIVTAGGKWGQKRAQRVIDTSMRLAREGNDARGVAFTLAQRATVAYARDGRFKETLGLCDEAEQVLRAQCHGVSYDLAKLALLVCGSLWYRGGWAQMKERAQREQALALARGDCWTAANVCSAGMNSMYLMEDEPVEARLRLNEGRRMLPTDRVYMATLLDLNGSCNVDLYEDRCDEAHRTMEAMWKPLQHSLLAHVPVLGVIAHETRGRAALGAAELAVGARRKNLLDIARRSARSCRRLRYSVAVPTGNLLEATVARLEGRDAEALALLDLAARGFAAAEADVYLPFIQCAQGKLLGGDSGRALLAEGCATLTARGMRRPERVAATFAPGFGLGG